MQQPASRRAGRAMSRNPVAAPYEEDVLVPGDQLVPEGPSLAVRAGRRVDVAQLVSSLMHPGQRRSSVPAPDMTQLDLLYLVPAVAVPGESELQLTP